MPIWNRYNHTHSPKIYQNHKPINNKSIKKRLNHNTRLFSVIFQPILFGLQKIYHTFVVINIK